MTSAAKKVHSESIISRRTVSIPIRKFMLPENASLFPRTDFMLPEKASMVLQREFMLPEKASLLIPGRELIVSRRNKLVLKVELGDCDNSLLVATSGTCRISGCLATEITRAPCWTKSWRPSFSDVFEVQTLFAPLKNTLRENTGHNTWMLCLMIRRNEQENMANLTFCPQDVHSPFTIRGEHEEKCNAAKRCTVDIFTERDRTFTESGRWIRLLHLYLCIWDKKTYYQIQS